MEVKPLRRATTSNLLGDIKKLMRFTDEGGYLLGVLLLYDHRSNEQPPREIGRLIAQCERAAGKLALAWHCGPDIEYRSI